MKYRAGIPKMVQHRCGNPPFLTGKSSMTHPTPLEASPNRSTPWQRDWAP